MKIAITKLVACHAASLSLALGLAATAIADEHAKCVESEGPSLATHPSPTLPYSSLLSAEDVQLLQQQQSKRELKGYERCQKTESGKDAIRTEKALESCLVGLFYEGQEYKNIRKRYEVSISTRELGGVLTEVFTPTNGVAVHNKDRVLINLHSGGFLGGSRMSSHLESIPISAVAKIKVISVDYRLAPEFHFPAASEDVAAVYMQLLKEYKPANIGIFGCSAGGVLTAQSIAWLQQKKLPMPGAVGMFCGAATYWSEGDSGNFARMWEERPATITDDEGFEYFRKENFDNSLVYPARSKDIMSHFPPSLLITSTRDLALSSVVYTHSMLIQQGVPAELYVWEGLPHGFFLDPDFPESREMYKITARFFERYLGRIAPESHGAQVSQ